MRTQRLGFLEEKSNNFLERFAVTLFGTDGHPHKTALGTVRVIIQLRGSSELLFQAGLAVVEETKEFFVMWLLLTGVVSDVEGGGLHGMNDEIEKLGVGRIATCNGPSQETLHIMIAFPERWSDMGRRNYGRWARQRKKCGQETG